MLRGNQRPCLGSGVVLFIQYFFLAASCRPSMRFLSVRQLLLSGGLLAGSVSLSVPAVAQDLPRKSEIRGVVMASDSLVPLAGIRVSLEGHDQFVATDKKGRFKFSKLTEGEYLLRAEIEGYPPTTTTVKVGRRERVEVEFLVGAPAGGQALPDVEVTAPNQRISPVIAFNRRLMEGKGRYITRQQIEHRKPATMMDLLRTVPGIRVVCPRNEHICALQVRHTCGPAYYLNGVPADPSVLWLMSPMDVEGVEIYSGPSETPIELEGGVNTGCGVIAIWTRVGERPKKTP